MTDSTRASTRWQPIQTFPTRSLWPNSAKFTSVLDQSQLTSISQSLARRVPTGLAALTSSLTASAGVVDTSTSPKGQTMVRKSARFESNADFDARIAREDEQAITVDCPVRTCEAPAGTPCMTDAGVERIRHCVRLMKAQREGIHEKQVQKQTANSTRSASRS